MFTRSVHLAEISGNIGSKKKRASIPSMRAAGPVERLIILKAAVFVGFRKRCTASMLKGRLRDAVKNEKKKT